MTSIPEHIARERAAERDLIERSGISEDEITATLKVLRAIGAVDLADLQTAPAFNIGRDGEVNSVNAATPEYRHYQQMSGFRDRAAWIADNLDDYWFHTLRGGQ